MIMKKTILFSTIVCILLVILAFTTFRGQESKSNPGKTSKHPGYGIWFQQNFKLVHVLKEEEIQQLKDECESWYTEFLYSNERTSHVVIYDWERIKGGFRISAFVSPDPTISVSAGSKNADPPSPPAPPPPDTVW
jgi:hypothetical protein